MQAIEAAGLSRLSVETRDNALDGGADIGPSRDESGQPFADGSRDVLPPLLVFRPVRTDGRQLLERVEMSWYSCHPGLDWWARAPSAVFRSGRRAVLSTSSAEPGSIGSRRSK